ncbi:MAG: aminotransferase class V-fold PLP-dependent enzyme, partial [Bdellovibrionaceae bacterium]|nr:aminotransferase class V-fold PLP-dependent enzyme [Pseudobdellovibrionaceae bacterium]
MANTFFNFPEIFSKFNAFHNGENWFTAHSHHFWPDCTEEALTDYWMDSAKLVDEKWNHIFTNKIPKLKKYLAQHLEINSWQNFVFAPNTHELLFRLLTCQEFNRQKKIKVLTTKNEFHSFSRQIKLLEEHHFVEVDALQFSDISNLHDQIESKLITNSYDFIFLSHVFFNLGLTISTELLDLIYEKTKQTSTKVILDAYHSFMALPFSMSKYENHFFYLAGSYKYAA